MAIYLDNAATTPVEKDVTEAMLPYLQEQFGNPSSIHSFGRLARAAVEKARKTIADHLHADPGEVIFTSGGTEANNMILRCSIRDLGVRTIISSPLEHHCVLHTVEALEKETNINLQWVKFKPDGHMDLDHLDTLLQKAEKPVLVSLMHANNEIGNMLDIEAAGSCCRTHDAFFHSDSVQTAGHYKLDMQKLPVDFMTGSAHKFHGPKGIGFAYLRKELELQGLLFGGSQERELRGGTENVPGIVGMAEAFDRRHTRMDKEQKHVRELKSYAMKKLREAVPGITFNGDAEGESLCTVLSTTFPPHEINEMLLLNLDMEGVAASAGSACSSGSNAGSHVINALGTSEGSMTVRFSFSFMNSREDIDFLAEKLHAIFQVDAPA